MSEFNVNCPVLDNTPPLEHECGVKKTISFASAGTFEKKEDFYFIYGKLTNLKPVYITVKPTVAKLFKITFTPGSFSGTNLKVRLKQIIGNELILVAEYNLGTLSSETSFFRNFTLDSDTKNDLTIFIDVVATGGGGQFDCTFDCEPQITSAEFCYGYTNSNQYCKICPQTVTLYKEKSKNSNITNLINISDTNYSNFQEGPWYTDPDLFNEVGNNEIYGLKTLDVKKSSYYQYNSSTNKFSLYSGCGSTGGGAIQPCGSTSVEQSHTLSNYTATSPYLPTATGIKPNGLKYSVISTNFNLLTKNRLVKVTVSYDIRPADVQFIVTDGADDTELGYLSYAFDNTDNTVYSAMTEYTSFKVDVKTSSRWDCFWNGCSYRQSMDIYVISRTGNIRVRTAVGQNKSYNSNQTIKTTVTVDCGTEIYGYDMGVHPYSAYDAYNNPKIITKIWSKYPISQWSGSTNNYTVKGVRLYNSDLLLDPALPYFYGDFLNTNKVYQVGNLVSRSFGHKTIFKVSKKGWGGRNTEKIVIGPKEWLNYYGRINDPERDYAPRTVPMCIYPTMAGVGRLNKIINSTSLIQPTVYSYLGGGNKEGLFVGSPEYLMTNEQYSNYSAFQLPTYFNDPRFIGKVQAPEITGLEHLAIKMTVGYGTGTDDRNMRDYLRKDIQEMMVLGIFTALSISAYMQANAPGAAPTNAYYKFNYTEYDTIPAGESVGEWVPGISQGLADAINTLQLIIFVMTVAAAIATLFMEFEVMVSENCTRVNKKYATVPFLTIGSTLYNFLSKTTSDLTELHKGWFNDGSIIHIIPTGSTTGEITERKLSYKTNQDGTKTYSIEVIPNDLSKKYYILDFTRLFMLFYVSGYPERFGSATVNSSTSISGTSENTSETIGVLNNSVPVKYVLPEGFITSLSNDVNDAQYEAQAVLNSIVASTDIVKKSFEKIPGVAKTQLIFSHEIKNENTPNFVDIFYNDGDSTGLSVGKTIYYDEDGLTSALNGYYSIYDNTNYKLFYKIEYGVITDILSQQYINSTTVTSLVNSSTYNVVTTNVDHTSYWFKTNDTVDSSYNTLEYYDSPGIVRGFKTPETNPDSLYLYDFNLNVSGTTFQEAVEDTYTNITNITDNDTTFTYYKPYSLFINSEEICTATNENGVRFYITDTNNVISPTYVGATFEANIYTGSSVLYKSVKLNIYENDIDYFFPLDISNSGGTITDVVITKINDVVIQTGSESSTYNKISLGVGDFTQATPITMCDFYQNGLLIITSYGWIEYQLFDELTRELTLVREDVYEGVHVINGIYSYPTLQQRTDNIESFPPANFSIINYGDCYVPLTPTPTPTVTNTPTVTPTITPTPTTICEFGLSVVVLTPTPTPTVTVTPTITLTPTVTPTITPTPTTICEFGLSVVVLTPTPTPTSTVTVTPTLTPTVTPTITLTPTVTTTMTPTPTTICEFGLSVQVLTPTPTPTPTSTPNYPPTNILLGNDNINENTATGTTIGGFSTVTLDNNDSHTYTLVSGTGDSDNASFTLTTGGTLKNAVVPNYEAKSSYSIRVRTTDSAGQTYEKAFTIYVNNVNETPYVLSLSNTSQVENTETGTTIGTFSTSDVDSGDTFTYSLVAGTGDNDNASFSIDGSSLNNAIVFNYESKSSYSIRVRTTDAGGLYYEATFTITVTNANEAPTDIILSSYSISENVPTGTTVGTFSATDPEGGAMTYELFDTVNYPDNNNFTITSGVLKSAVVFNYEVKSSYLIRVKVTDSTNLTFTKLITISITDVTITPTLTATNATCYGAKGSITVSGVVGGTANYTYSKDGTNYQVDATFSNLDITGHTIYAKDSYGEVGSSSITLTQPTAVSVSASGTNPTCFGSTDGSILVGGASGGSGTGYTYSRDGITYQTGTTFSNLTNGTYTIYAKDNAGCTGSTSVTLNRTQITAEYTKTEVFCSGAAEGSITVTSPSGGQGGPYQTKLNAGGTYQQLTTSRVYSSLLAGTYTLYVKDSGGCERTYSIVITEPTPFVITPVVTHPTCFGDSDGSITVNVSGGNLMLQLYYAISSNLGSTYSNFQTSNVFYNLPAGSSYIVKIEQEITGCQKTYGPITLAKSAVTTTLTPSHLTCFAQNSDGIYAGSVSIAYPSGGNGAPYKIKLGSGGTFTEIPAGTTTVWGNLRGGSKTVYIRDAQNCEFTFTTTVNEPTQVTASVTSSNPTCYGGTGSITVTSLSGGSGSGYQVKLGSGGTYENFSSSKTYSSLGDGSYTVYVKDSLGCETTYVRTITVPAQVTVGTSSLTYTTCHNGSNGSVTLTASGGNGSYQYRINSGTWVNESTFNNLGATSYTFQSKDSNDCTSSIITVDFTKSAPNCTRVVTNVSCNGGSNGSIATSSPLGGNSGVYTVSIDGFDYFSFPKTFSNLTAGNYTVYVKDYLGCVQSYAEAITQPTAQSASISNVVNAPCADPSGGSLTISSGGGVWPKTYRLYEDETSPYDTCGGTLRATYTGVTSDTPSRNVTSLTSGGYCLEVTDANGCVTNSGITVLADEPTYYRYQVINCASTAYTTMTSPDNLPSQFTTGTRAVKINGVCYQIDYLFDTVCTQGAIHLTDGQNSGFYMTCADCTGGGQSQNL